ncbi:hypothetical protein FSP39_013432 [Pinctada imbricata]|uniref:Endonuclease n=1 Tax=Pinctada imbricata TaxID=66713 RepID=A0AA88XDS1_PINIB|nr:hypothetical protein FSP39_013432 [Pinctada imbricata]
MDLDQINASIRELEAKIRASEQDHSLSINSPPLSESTPLDLKPKHGRSLTRDSGFVTLHPDNEPKGARMSQKRADMSNERVYMTDKEVDMSQQRAAVSSDQGRSKRKSVHFKNDNNYGFDDNKYDLSQYLPHNEPRPVPARNITTRHNRGLSQSEPPAARTIQKVKPATYDGTTSWLDYKSHFDACAKLGKWSEEEKGLYLSVSLRGLAQGILGNLTTDDQLKYKELVSALNDRFSPPDQMELYRIQLRERHQKASESLPELGQHIRRLTNQAYPTVPADVRETLAKDQFIDALVNSDIRIRIKQARPQNLNDAIRHAVELEAYFKAEGKLLESKGHIQEIDSDSNAEACSVHETDKLKSSLDEIKKALELMSAKINDLETKRAERKDDTLLTKLKAQEQRKTKTENKTVKDGSYSHLHTDANCGIGGYLGSSGIFVKLNIDGANAHFLIDTGASLSIFSKDTFDKIKNKPEIDSVNKKILAANGEPLKVYGRTRLKMKIGKKSYTTTVIIADLNSDGVLGLDFMLDNSCILDIQQQKITIQNESIPLVKSGHFGCFRVAVSETLNIPPKPELIAKCNVCLNDGLTLPPGDSLIEPDENFLASDRGLIGKLLVSNNKRVPIRIMNVSDDVKVIRAGTVVANLSPAEVVSTESDTNSFRRPDDQNLTSYLEELLSRSSAHLTTQQKSEARAFLLKHSALFALSEKDFWRTKLVKHRINTGNRGPIKERLRRTPVRLRQTLDQHIDDMLQRDVIEHSSSPWASGIVLARKKDGSTRFCVDYRKLNEITVKDAYPLPRIDETLDHLAGACWFSTLDMSSGYWQVEVDENDREKTSFTTKRGLYQFKVMPFGLCNAPATFERLMEMVLCGLQWTVCLVYLDDIVVIGKSFHQMLKNLECIFNRLSSAGLKLKARKCSLFAKKVEYLGHIISEKGVSTDPRKITTVQNWEEPKSVKELRSFLGLCSYYRRFIKGFATIAKPLHKLTSSDTMYVWTKECQEAFNSLKFKLTNSPILAYPDFREPFILDTDASEFGIGAVLSQKINREEKVIAYASRVLSKSEKRYCVTRKELLAVVTYVKHFRHYLYGREFTVRTDHSSLSMLRWLLNFKNPEGQMARWLETLAMFNMTIEHRPGTQHKNADSLSRKTCNQCKFDPTWEDKNMSQSHQVISLEEDFGNEKTLSELQKEDTEISKVREWLETKQKPDSTELSLGGVMMKSLWSQRALLVIYDDMLYRRWTDNKGSTLQAIVPFKERLHILQFSHDHKTSGHLGVTKTLSKIRQSYYWPGLQRDVRHYIAGCEVCAKSKGPTKTKRAPMQLVGAGFPMERIAMDIVGELPLTERGNRYILVVSDYFTKWVEAFAMPNMEAKTVADIVAREIVARLGVPNIIHSDQGKQFEGKVFTEMCKISSIKKTRTTPYHPQSDGMVERFNKTMMSMLKTLVDDNQRNWDILLPYVIMAYRSVEHESTGCSPNYLMLGREVATPLDIAYEMPTSLKKTPSNQWAWELKERLETANNLV